MGRRTIGLDEKTYQRLKARKRKNESFTDLVERLLAETSPDWRDRFGTLSSPEAEELERGVVESQRGMAEGLVTRQQDTIETLSESREASDESG